MADNCNVVAFLLRRRQHRCRFLLYKSKHHQLAFHRLPLRIRRRLSSHDMDSIYWWPPSRNYHSIRSYPNWKLDTLCWRTNFSSQFRPYDVRSDPHRSGATLCPLSAHSLLRHLVHTLGPRFRHRDRFAREPLRRRARPTHQPILSEQSI